MKKTPTLFFLALCLAVVGAPAFGHKAHTHGVARLNLAIDGDSVEIGFATPLINLISFERAPKNDKEREEARRTAALLQDADNLFVFPSDAECSLKNLRLESEAIASELNPAHGKDAHETKSDHNDLDAEFVFICQNPAALNQIEVRLFQAFPKMKRIEAELVTPRGQKAIKLAPKANRISW
jgi:uncharacterized protein YfcZ (UPF0381/DUF406 family)